MSVTVRIVPRPEHPFKIKSIRALRGEHIRFALKPLVDGSQPSYELTISSTRQEPGRIVDAVSLETDSPIRPQIQVQVFGEIIAAKQ